jgi:hypothetical protein
VIPPVAPVVAPVISPVAPMVAPVISPVAPVVAPVIPPVAPMVAPVIPPVAPVVAPVIPPVAPVVAPVVPIAVFTKPGSDLNLSVPEAPALVEISLSSAVKEVPKPMVAPAAPFQMNTSIANPLNPASAKENLTPVKNSANYHEAREVTNPMVSPSAPARMQFESSPQPPRVPAPQADLCCTIA